MPAQSQWLLRVPEIREQVERLTAPVLDRSILENLFGVRRRRAIMLMHSFGGYQSGKTFLVDRSSLLRQLESLEAGEEFSHELRRKERLADELDRVRAHLRAARVSVQLPDEVVNTRLKSLPEGVQLEPEVVIVHYKSPEQLLERLFALAQALANDLDILLA